MTAHPEDRPGAFVKPPYTGANDSTTAGIEAKRALITELVAAIEDGQSFLRRNNVFGFVFGPGHDIPTAAHHSLLCQKFANALSKAREALK